MKSGHIYKINSDISSLTKSNRSSDSYPNSTSKYGNDDYTFVDPATKRVDRLDQAFSPTDINQGGAVKDTTFTGENVKSSATDLKTVDVNKDVSIEIDDTKPESTK